jgi:uncharacterized protein DUF4394/Calx-beta domain-containing protein
MLRAMCPLAALVLLVAMPRSAQAETIVGLVEGNNLVTFDSARPGDLLSALPITGLPGGELILGIDFRPETGQLYGFGHLGAPGVRLYIFDPATGAATLVSTLAADPADTTDPYTDVVGTDFGVDFNPVPDRIRLVTDTGQNLRVNPDTGVVTTDTPLAFAAGDPNAGRIPKVVDAAYSNNDANATSTTLYGLEGIDPDLGCQKAQTDGTVVRALCLVRQGGADGTPSPNLGQLFTLGPFGKEGTKAKGFDISPSGTAFVAVQLKEDPLTTFVLVTIDLTNGADSSRGPVGDGTVRLKDIAVAPSVQFSASLYAVHENAGTATITVTRNDDLTGTVAVNFATSDGTAKAGQDYGTTTGTLTFNPGDATRSFTIPIINDRRPERDQFLLVTLSNPSGGELLGAPGRCVLLSRPSPCVRGTAELRIDVNDRVDRTGPILQRIGLTGPSRGITGAVLHFNEDLRPASAQNLRNYSFFAFGAGRRRQRIALGSAVYDPVTRAVTLTVREPFRQTQFTHLQIVVRGKKGGVTDLRRNLLDGEPDSEPGGDAVFRFRVFSGTAVSFRDLDGDLATLVLTGGGRLDGIVPIRAPRVISVSNFPPRQLTQFWILDPIALKSTLSGTVRPRGDGIVVIAEIIGLDKKEFTPLITNPSFRVNTLTFSSNATGR